PAFFFVRGGLERFPDAFAGVGLEAAQLAVAAHAVDVAVLDDRGRHDGVQAVGLVGKLALAFAAPKYGFRRLVRVELEHDRAVVEAAHQQLIAGLSWVGDRHAGLDRERLGPILATGFGVERMDGLRIPDNELPLAAGFDDGRRAVALG